MATVERDGRTAIVHLRGDAMISSARRLHATLDGLARADLGLVVLDCSELARIDSAGVAAIELARRELERTGARLELEHLGDVQRAAFALSPTPTPHVVAPNPALLEVTGERVLEASSSVRAAARLIADVLREAAAVALGRRHMTSGAVLTHVVLMGVDGVFVVGLLSFLLGVTIAFQGVVQLSDFGASVFVADMVGWSMIREFAPFVAAIVLSGRTGAAIAAELGAMHVGQEIDALDAMGVSPARFLVLPRLAALTIALPCLTLIAMLFGIAGGMFVTRTMLDMTVETFWARMVAFVELDDFVLGFVKSFVFAWIIGFTGSHLGLRASSDASGVGKATTRTVVVSIFLIIVVDSIFASAITAWGH